MVVVDPNTGLRTEPAAFNEKNDINSGDMFTLADTWQNGLQRAPYKIIDPGYHTTYNIGIDGKVSSISTIHRDRWIEIYVTGDDREEYSFELTHNDVIHTIKTGENLDISWFYWHSRIGQVEKFWVDFSSLR